MSDNAYIRCHYQDETGLACDNWFRPESPEIVFCDLHIGAIGATNGLASPEIKSDYIRLRNEQDAICALMSLDELDAHIAGIEKVIELERAKLLAARGNRSGKLQLLSDEERAERRKIRTPREIAPERKVSKVAQKVATIKSDPVKYFMDSLGFTQENAEALARSKGLLK